MKRIGPPLLAAAFVWILVYALDLLIGFTPRYGPWFGAALAFVSVLWLRRAKA